MRIESNVGQVAEQLRAVRTGVNRARVLMVAPSWWWYRAKSVAAVALGVAIAKEPQLEQHIGTIVDAIMIEVFAGLEPGFELSLRALPIRVEPTDIAALSAASVPRAMVANRSDAESLPLWRAAFFTSARTGEALEAIQLWVNSGQKRIKERDKGLSNETIAKNVYDVLFGRTRSPKKDSARESLLKTDTTSANPAEEMHPHLLDSVRRVAEAESLNAQHAAQWLDVVLKAWCAMIKAEWRDEFWEAYRSKPTPTFSLKGD